MTFYRELRFVEMQAAVCVWSIERQVLGGFLAALPSSIQRCVSTGGRKWLWLWLWLLLLLEW